MQKLTPSYSSTPKGNAIGAIVDRIDKTPDHSRQHMRILKIEVVIRTVKVTRHNAYTVKSVLPVIVFRHLEPRDLGNSIPLVCRFQRSAQQIFLFHRLFAFCRIDTRASQKAKFFHTV